MTRPPCYDEATNTDCPRRYVGCKAGCEEWHRWLAIHEEEKDKIRRGREKYNDIEGCMVDQTKRVNQDRQRRYTERHRKSHGKG